MPNCLYSYTGTGPIAEANFTRRKEKLKVNEDNLKLQTKKLFETQRDFYNLMSKIYYDVQLTILKSIITIQSQFLKLTDIFDKNQLSNHTISKRMRFQLMNAATNLMQMIKDESSSSNKPLPILTSNSSSSSTGNSPPNNNNKNSAGVHLLQGYELSLQRVLEGLLLQSQLKDIDVTANNTNNYNTNNNIANSNNTINSSTNTNEISSPIVTNAGFAVSIQSNSSNNGAAQHSDSIYTEEEKGE